ncbi:IclR family transcriptional regulator, partial [Escherichia coli]|nr:IclR family transcriptional regulator [Escherichia coli]
LQDSWLDNLKDTALQISKGMGYTHEDDTVRAE